MSIQWMDDFKGYTTSANMLNGSPWAVLEGAVIAADPDPSAESASRVLKAKSGSSGPEQTTRLALPTPATKAGVTFRLWLDTLPTGNSTGSGIVLLDGANNALYCLHVNPNGSLSLFRGRHTTLLATTATPVFSAGSFAHLEILVDLTTGSLAVWKEGTALTDLTITDATPPTGPIGMVGFFANRAAGSNGGNLPNIKDLYIYDGNGSQNNSQAGVLSIFRLSPSSDVSNGWTVTGGATATSVLDKPSAVNDATFISAPDTLPADAVLNLDDLPDDVIGVRGLMTLARMRKSDSGDATVQVALISNGDVDTGADRAISTTFSYYWDVSELDPDTGAAWSPIAVNQATVSIERTS